MFIGSPYLTAVAAGAVLLFWCVGAYNRLVRLRGAVVQTLLAIAQHWRTQVLELRQQTATFVAIESESQWGVLHGDAPWGPTLAAALQLNATLAKVLDAPNVKFSVDQVAILRAAVDVLATSWQRWSQSNDDLAGPTTPADLQQSWLQNSMRSDILIKEFNASANIYNAARRQFPANVLAWIFSFEATGNL